MLVFYYILKLRYDWSVFRIAPVILFININRALVTLQEIIIDVIHFSISVFLIVQYVCFYCTFDLIVSAYLQYLIGFHSKREHHTQKNSVAVDNTLL